MNSACALTNMTNETLVAQNNINNTIVKTDLSTPAEKKTISG